MLLWRGVSSGLSAEAERGEAGLFPLPAGGMRSPPSLNSGPVEAASPCKRRKLVLRNVRRQRLRPFSRAEMHSGCNTHVPAGENRNLGQLIISVIITRNALPLLGMP
jgi:hypothetical protein